MDTINVDLAKKVTEIMTEFDFETTVKILKLMDIKWTCDGETRHPNLIDVKETVNDLLWEVIEKAYDTVSDFYFSECKCFRAEYHQEIDDEYVELMFEPCSWRRIC